MELWHPRAWDARSNRLGGTFIRVAPKIVLHTTESTGDYQYNPGDYYGHQFWPHATIDTQAIHQHLGIDAAAYALYRQDVQTNNANVIQCEIVWRAGDIENLPEETLANIADWIGWVAEQTGCPLAICPQGFHGPGEGIVLASEFSPIRFGNGDWPDWYEWSGICGHQHVGSGNDHWDPGKFPVGKLMSYFNGPSPQPGDDFLSELSAEEQRKVFHATQFTGEVLNEWKGVIAQGGDGDYGTGLRKLVKLLQQAEVE